MVSTEERIEELEKEIRETKYNKATQHHIGLLKAKLAQLKDEQQRKISGGAKGEGYAVRKTGDGTVVMVGYPSVGKSTLINALTNAESKVASYEFTTLDVIPGMLEYKNAQIQLLDVPGMVKGAASGKGRGKEVMSVVRNADLILIVLDVNKPEHLAVIHKELYDTGIRINTEMPDVKITRKSTGGSSISSTVKQPHVDLETLKGVMEEYRLLNVDIVIRSRITIDEFIDALEGNRVYIPAVTVVNKADKVTKAEMRKVLAATGADLAISAEKGTALDDLKQMVFERLQLIRIFLKEVGKKPDMEEPLIMKKGGTVEDVCRKLHRDFVTKFKYARCWGPSAKFPGQRKMLHHPVQDRDVLEIHLL